MEDTLKERCEALNGWSVSDAELCKQYTFKDFTEALGFLVKVGICAEKANHHPNIENVYNRVTLRLNTHDAGGKVTEKDAALAEAIDAL